MTLNDLRDHVALLEKKVASLEASEKLHWIAVSLNIPIDARNKARLMAFESVVRDLAHHAGVSQERVEFVILERTRQKLDALYRMCEDSDPTAAARNDDRDQGEFPTLEENPPLFDDLKA